MSVVAIGIIDDGRDKKRRECSDEPRMLIFLQANVVGVSSDLDSICSRDESGSNMENPWTEVRK